MFMAETLTAVTEAMKQTFDADYPVSDFQDLHIATTYPDQRVNYPGIWCDFDISSTVRTVGIGHVEWTDGDTPDTKRKVKRWRFAGRALYTVAALTNLERARLVDEVIRVVAFGRTEPGRSAYRDVIESNDFVALSGNFDEVSISGMSNMPGTPWGSDEVIYEATLALDIIGEFVSDAEGAAELAPLSAVTITEYIDGEQPEEEGWL